MTERFHHELARLVHAARWVMAPIYLGLFTALGFLVFKFGQELVALAIGLSGMTGTHTVLAVLRLVDLSLLANLILIIILGGWGNVIGPLPPDRSAFADIGFGEMKLRLIASITAIAAIQVLETFVHIEDFPSQRIMWQLLGLLGLALAGLLLALMDRLSGGH